MSEKALLIAIIRGRVQGVYFRAFVRNHAEALGLTGYVRNLPGGSAIEVRAEGEKTKLDELLNQLNIGPPRARVDRVDVEWSEYTGRFKDFQLNY
jgi:acylphosphatase